MSQKTKRVEITTCWAAFHKTTFEFSDVHIKDPRKYLDNEYDAIPCTITFDIPVKEPEITITPSKLNEHIQKYMTDNYYNSAVNFYDYLKVQIFGEEWFK